MLRKWMPVLLIVVLALVTVLPVSAQDGGLSAEEQALVQRIVDAAAASENFNSFAMTRTRTQQQQITFSMDTNILSSEESETTEGTVTFARDDAGTATFSDQFSTQISERSFSDTAPTEYTLSGEKRGVGDRLYLNVTRESADESTLAPMPEGWVSVTDPADFPALASLRLENILEDLGHPSIYDMSFADLLTHVTAASVEARTLDDGTPVDTITLGIKGADLIDGLKLLAGTAEDDASAQAYYAGISPDSTWTMVYDVNAAGDVIHFTTDVLVTWVDFDATILSDGFPAGTLLNQTLTQTGEYTINDINAPTDPFPAPEV